MRPTPVYLPQTLVWKELNYGIMREKEKQLIVSEVRTVSMCSDLLHKSIPRTIATDLSRCRSTSCGNFVIRSSYVTMTG